MLTQARLLRHVEYDPETGVFLHLKSCGPTKAGRRAGCLTPRGYRQISVGGRGYREHRLAWLYVHGRWPKAELDHINGCRADNRLSNLREAASSQNRLNSRPPRNTKTTAAPGVREFLPGRWRVTIGTGRKKRHLGVFYDLSAALRARQRAENEIEPEFRPDASNLLVRPVYQDT